MSLLSEALGAHQLVASAALLDGRSAGSPARPVCATRHSVPSLPHVSRLAKWAPLNRASLPLSHAAAALGTFSGLLACFRASALGRAAS